jgi:hypothetical protein
MKPLESQVERTFPSTSLTVGFSALAFLTMETRREVNGAADAHLKRW